MTRPDFRRALRLATAAVTNFVEDLYNQGITGGCSASPLLYCYCPTNPNTRRWRSSS